MTLQHLLIRIVYFNSRTLVSLRLPGSIEALEQPTGLPTIVLERSDEVKRKGGARSIDSAWVTLTSFANEAMQILQEVFCITDAVLEMS